MDANASIRPDIESDHRSAATSPGGSIVNNGTLTLDQHRLDALNGTSYEEIAAWGDSLTAGNAAGPGNQYPSLLAKDFNGGRTVLNEGEGGDTSTQVADRLIAATSLRKDTVIIWAGLNNVTDPTQVMADTASMISALGSNSHYVIMSLINPDGPNDLPGGSVSNDINNINSQLAATYPGHYLDVLSILINDYNPSSPTDVVDHNNGVVPTSLRIDDGHLNAAGNAIVAEALYNFITTQLDGSLPPTFTIAGSGIITTAAATLNLSGFDTDDNTIQTTNPLGTAFTVDNLNTAMNVFGTSGFNILIDNTDDFTAQEQTNIFSHGIEEIVDENTSYLAPGANPPPTIIGLTDDTGRFDDDGVTSQINPTLEGTATAGSTVSIYATIDDGTPTLAGETDADSNGDWTFQLTQPSGETEFLDATAAIGSGTASVPSNPFGVTVDTKPPARPAVTILSPGRIISKGVAATSGDVLKFQGTAQNDAEIEIFIDGQLVGTTQAKPSRIWTYYNAALVLSPGEHTFYAVAIDLAGNVGNPSITYHIDVETTPPGPPALSLINGSAAGANGKFDVRGGGVILTGAGVAGDSIRFSISDTVVGSVVVDASGQWEFDYSSHPLASGAYLIEYRQIDLAGGESTTGAARVSVSDAPISNSLEVHSGEFIADLTVEAGGVLQIDQGAVGRSLRIAGATAADLVYGAATGSNVRAGGSETVESGGTATGTSVATGGAQTVVSGGVATGAIVNGGATETVEAGGIASNIWIKAGGNLVDEGSVTFLTTKPGVLSGNLTGSGTLAEDGGGELTLAGMDGGFSGEVTVGDGSLVLSNVTLGGAVVVGAGARLRGVGLIEEAVTNLGSILENGGLLQFAGDVSGAGTVLINGGTADFAAAFNGDVRFTGSTGVLELGDSQAYAGEISGLSTAGTSSLDLEDISFAEGVTSVTAVESATSTKLTILSGAQAATISLLGDYEGSTFVALSDGHGGTSIVDPSAAPTSRALVSAIASFEPRAPVAESDIAPFRTSVPLELATPGVAAA
jgi:autotransporter passenger strand-loop-strand repeat protein